MGAATNIAARLSDNLATGETPSVAGFGLSAYLEGQVPFYEWWDVRYNVLHDSGFMIDIKGMRRGLSFPRASASAGPAFDIDVGLLFGGLATLHTYTDGSVGRGMLQAATGLGQSFPGTTRPHLMAYMSAKNPAAAIAGFRILNAAGSSQFIDRDDTTARASAQSINSGGTITAVSANNAYVADTPHMREVWRDASNLKIAIDGVEVATAAAANDFTSTLDRLDTRNASTSASDRRYAVLVFASAKIPDAVRAQIQAYCVAAFPPP